MVVLFVCVDALHPSQQFFSLVGSFSHLPGLNQYTFKAENKCQQQLKDVGRVPKVECPTHDKKVTGLNPAIDKVLQWHSQNAEKKLSTSKGDDYCIKQ